MTNSSLKSKAFSGMIWSFMQRFGTMAISFASNIILARLLTPDDYGIIGMLMIFIAVSNTFIDGGFGSALIQKQEPTQEDYSTIFYWNIFFSICIYLILFFTAPAISSFYNLAVLTNILRIQGLVLCINALSIIQVNQLRKHLEFRKLAVINILSSILSVSLAIYFAYSGWGVWSLVAQQLSFSLFASIFTWSIGKWIPSLIFSWKSFKSLFSFGSFILLSSLINTLFNNINSLIIGRVFNASIMGYFSQAKKIEDATAMSMTSVIEQVTYPILAEYQKNTEKMRNVIKRFNTMAFFIVTPIMLLICLSADSIIIFLFTEKWLPSVPYLRILALHGIPMSLQGVNYNAIAAIGKSKALFTAAVIKRIITVSIMLIGVYINGIIGLLWAMVIAASLIVLYNMLLVSRYLDYSFLLQIKDLSSTILVSIVTYLIIYLLQQNLLINNLILSGLFCIIYIILAFILQIDAFKSLVNILLSKIKIKSLHSI